MPSGGERAGDFPHVLDDTPGSVRCPTEANLKLSEWVGTQLSADEVLQPFEIHSPT
jgi:hypothetical protein